MAVYSYVRCSTETQMDNNGFEMQYDVIRKYCTENEITIEARFEDEGISGTKLDRNGLIELLATLKAGDKVIVQNTSRLWREGFVKEMIRKQIKDANADIISIEQPTYTVYETDPEDFLFNSIMELFDQYDRMKIAMKLKKGRIARARNGNKACGTAPIGYKWDGNNIVINAEESIIVQSIFEAYRDLGSIQKVVDYTIENGYKTSTGCDFSKKSIQRILRNDFYIGIVTHGEIKAEGTHSPIISNELFEIVNSKLDGKTDKKIA